VEAGQKVCLLTWTYFLSGKCALLGDANFLSDMKPEAEREEDLFKAAIALTAPDRLVFLNVNCADDPGLRRRLEDLLAAHHAPDSFMTELSGPGRTVLIPAIEIFDETVGQSIGRYKLLEKLGEGGCGVVYVAEQSAPMRRRVALKVIKLGMDTRQVIARFEAERQALAMMDHPNIAKVLDGGATELGRPYFVMELVRGIPITSYCDQNHLATRERLDLFQRVCHAIQHAHQKGIIHRDLKPSNILVTLHDGIPVPKVIDFGIAKATEGRLTDSTVYTALHQLIGTPAYMSPEQAEMSGLDVDTRSDIYSLGVLLYELLIGRPPFDPAQLVASGVDAMRKTIREREPLRPSTRLASFKADDLTSAAKRRRIDPPRLVHLIKGDLDWIVMKCLEKDRTRRYETANGLAMDVERHLKDEPVLARPPSKTYRFIKTVRRHSGAFTAASFILAALVIGIVYSVSQTIRARRAEDHARTETEHARIAENLAVVKSALANTERLRAETSLYAADMNVVQQALSESNLRRARERLRAYLPTPGSPDLRGWEWWHFSRMAQGDEVFSLQTPGNSVISILPSPTLNHLILGWEDGKVELWDALNARPSRLLAQLPGGLRSLLLDSRGEFLALHGHDGTVQIWDYRDPSKLTLVQSWKSSGALRAFFPARKLIATVAEEGGRWELPGSDYGLISMWNYETGEKITTLPRSGEAALFSSDGQTLFTGSWHGSATLWNTADWSIRKTIPQVGRVINMALSPDDRSVLISSFEKAGLYDIAGQKPPWILGDSSSRLWTMRSAFSPDRNHFALAYGDGTIGLWDFSNHREVARFKGHESDVLALAFSKDGQWLVSADPSTDTMRIFKAAPPQTRELTIGMFSPTVFSRDSRFLAVGDKSGETFACAIWDLAANQKRTLPAEPNPLAFTPDGLLVTATVPAFLPIGSGRISGLKHWDIHSGSLKATIPFLETNFLVSAVALSPDCRTLAAGDLLGNVLLWDATSGVRNGTLASSSGRVWNLTFSPDGKKLAVGIIGNVSVWNLQTKERIFTKPALGSPLAFSLDAETLAISTEEEILLCRIATGAVETLTGHRERVYWLAFSPDGRTLASAAEDLKLWNLPAGREVASFRNLDFFMYANFSPDGKYLVGGTVGKAQIWSAEPFSVLGSPR
jgi:eukaryotic-like serine/threonine-protein kinase